MLDTPNIVTTDFRHTAVIRLAIPRAEIRHVMGPGIGELLATLAAQGIKPASPVFSHHLRLHPDLWECYVAGPEANPDPATWRTELSRAFVA